MDIKIIAKNVRTDIAKAIKAGELPAIKTSVRISRFSMGQSLTVEVAAVPEGFKVLNVERLKWAKANPYLAPEFHGPEEARGRYTDTAKQLLETLKKIVGAYNWDRSDRMVDHFDVNFYEHVEFATDLEIAEREAFEKSAA